MTLAQNTSVYFADLFMIGVKREDYLDHTAENLKKAVKNAREHDRVILVESHLSHFSLHKFYGVYEPFH